MNKFLLITKINLLGFLDIKRVTNSKYKKERQRNVFKVLLFIFIILYLSYYVYEMVVHLMPGFMSINMPIHLLHIAFHILGVLLDFHKIYSYLLLLSLQSIQ